MALGLRLLVMAVAFGHTPFDVAEHFRLTGEAVLRQQDPLLTLPRYQWNFLPAMPYVHALELSTGLPWELVGKLCRRSPTWRPRSWSARCPPRSGRPGSAGSTRCTRRAVPAMVSYRSLAGSWGWTGLGRLHGGVGYGYAGPRAVFFYLAFFPTQALAVDRLLVDWSVLVIAAAVAALPWERLRGRDRGRMLTCPSRLPAPRPTTSSVAPTPRPGG